MRKRINLQAHLIAARLGVQSALRTDARVWSRPITLLRPAEQVSSHSRGHDPKGLLMRCKVQMPCVWHAVVTWQLLYHAFVL